MLYAMQATLIRKTTSYRLTAKAAYYGPYSSCWAQTLVAVVIFTAAKEEIRGEVV